MSELLNQILLNLGLVVDSSPASKLLDACTFGRISEAFTLLNNGTNPNIVDHENRSPLMLALESKGEFNEEFIHFLIQKIKDTGGDLDIEDNTNGTTALIKACAKSRIAAALQLIEAGASLDFVDVGEEDKMTALDYAILGNLDNVVNAIRRKGGHTFAELTRASALQGAGSGPELRLCCICCVNPITHLFLPCNHFCVCGDCANIMMTTRIQDKKCPICRQTLIGSSRVYIS
jgi:ankyrin repeat protein